MGIYGKYSAAVMASRDYRAQALRDAVQAMCRAGERDTIGAVLESEGITTKRGGAEPVKIESGRLASHPNGCLLTGRPWGNT